MVMLKPRTDQSVGQESVRGGSSQEVVRRRRMNAVFLSDLHHGSVDQCTQCRDQCGLAEAGAASHALWSLNFVNRKMQERDISWLSEFALRMYFAPSVIIIAANLVEMLVLNPQVQESLGATNVELLSYMGSLFIQTLSGEILPNSEGRATPWFPWEQNLREKIARGLETVMPYKEEPRIGESERLIKRSRRVTLPGFSCLSEDSETLLESLHKMEEHDVEDDENAKSEKSVVGHTPEGELSGESERGKEERGDQEGGKGPKMEV